MALTLQSSAFSHYGKIPSKYTCEGEDLSPPLSWSGLPQGTKSLCLIVDDPDAPDPRAPKMTYVHWVLYNIPISIMELAEAATDFGLRAIEGLNDWKRTGYGGPCPPIGEHRYFLNFMRWILFSQCFNLPIRPTLKKPCRGIF